MVGSSDNLTQPSRLKRKDIGTDNKTSKKQHEADIMPTTWQPAGMNQSLFCDNQQHQSFPPQSCTNPQTLWTMMMPPHQSNLPMLQQQTGTLPVIEQQQPASSMASHSQSQNNQFETEYARVPYNIPNHQYSPPNNGRLPMAEQTQFSSSLGNNILIANMLQQLQQQHQLAALQHSFGSQSFGYDHNIVGQKQFQELQEQVDMALKGNLELQQTCPPQPPPEVPKSTSNQQGLRYNVGAINTFPQGLTDTEALPRKPFPQLEHQNSSSISLTAPSTGSNSDSSLLDQLLFPLSDSSEGESETEGSAKQPSSQTLDFPLCTEGELDRNRIIFPLGIDEDPNWLSEYACLVRSELTEVFCASHANVKERFNKICYQQIGIRCRFCAHWAIKAKRASAYPSSLGQIYQSFTMMLRDHFADCEALPAHQKQKFLMLKAQASQGTNSSKDYWTYAAVKIGMTNTGRGIKITPQSRLDGANTPPYCTETMDSWPDDKYKNIHLVTPEDQSLISDAVYLLLSQAQPIRLLPQECTGKRRPMRLGQAGFGCRYCCEQHRLGMSRLFPVGPRMLPRKLGELHLHLRRCTLCPAAIKQELEKIHLTAEEYVPDDVQFFDQLWKRIRMEPASGVE